MALSYLADRDSKVPAKSRQGPHHDAPNWTTMSLGPALLTFSAKSASLSHWNTTIFKPHKGNRLKVNPVFDKLIPFLDFQKIGTMTNQVLFWYEA